MNTVRRTTIASGVIALITLFILPAQAATYQYWSYFHSGDAAWTMSMEGASRIPADGTVEGWRFVETSGDALAPEPRVAPDFTALCAGVEAPAGQKRVALVVDYGTVSAADQRDTLSTCVTVEESADGFAVLQAATTILATDGMVSCIQGVPSATCEPVPSLVTTTAGETTRANSGLSSWIYAVIAAGLVGAFLLLGRRKRN